MVFSVSSGLKVGSVTAFTSREGGHPPEFWADRMADKLCGISEDAEPHVRQQAYEFKQRVKMAALEYIQFAIKSDRGTVWHRLKKRGFDEAAQAVLEGLK